MHKVLFPLVIWLLIAAPHQVARGESARVEGSIDCSSISTCYVKKMIINGDIDGSTVDEVRRLIEELHRNADREKKQVHPFSVSLSSRGGSVTAAFALGRILRRENMGARVEGGFIEYGRKPHECTSACVLVFAGAVNREMGARSKLGIHRPYLEVPRQEISPDKVREGYLKMLQDVRAYLREMNVSEQLAEAMFRIEPERVRFLDDKAATAYGLTEWDPVYKEMRDVQEAKQLGLDRRGFMERRSRALSDCHWLRASIYDPIDAWLSCYDGVMTATRPAPVAPPTPPASPGIDFSQFGTPCDCGPPDWSRESLR